MNSGQRGIFRAFLVLVCFGAVNTQRHLKIPRTKFSCHGRATGYYADVDTGCQIYHMCDGLGRQFSYACPNTTLFQQRMLICDHWYMVNCSHSERDYSANLLIGQRDKPFVSDDEDHQRTPRPDILSAPYANGDNYYGFNKGHDSGNKYESVDENIGNGHNDINDELALFSVPTHWSTELTGGHHHTTISPFKHEHHEHDREHSHEKHSEHHHMPEHHQEHHPEHHQEHHPEHHQEHHPEHHQEHHPEHHPEHHNGEHHNPEHHNMEIIITEPHNPEHHNEHHHEHELVHHSEHQAFTGRPIIVGFPTSGESGESEVSHKHTFVTESNTEAPKISEILTNHGIELVVNLPSELFEPPNHEMTSIASTESEEGEGHHHHRLSSTTVRSIANFNNQFISSEVKSHESASHEKAHENSGENSKEIDEAEPFIEFIKRFDPNEETPIRSSFEKDQIEAKSFEIQSSSETSGFVPIVNNNHIHHAQPAKAHHQAHPTKHTIKINIHSDNSANSREIIVENEAPKPITNLVPPKLDYTEYDSSTVGPPIYYEWKWAPHALGLEPPTFSMESKDVPEFMGRKAGRPAFALPRPTTAAPVLEPSKVSLDQNNEIKLAPYFIPKYEFPLDKGHPGYHEDGALSSFQVKLSRSHDFKEGSHPNYAENSECPECHPSFLQPGLCTPCVTIKR